MVKNWTFPAGNGISPDPLYPYLNIPPVPFSGIITGPPYQYNWRFAEVIDAVGVAGQGTANPASWFNNHQVAKLGTTYYDPSYGVTYPSLDAIDSNALDGYYKGATVPVNESDVALDLNGNGTTTDPAVPTTSLLFQKNPTGNQLVENLHEYPF